MIAFNSRIVPLRRSRLQRLGTVIAVAGFAVLAFGIVILCEVLSRL